MDKKLRVETLTSVDVDCRVFLEVLRHCQTLLPNNDHVIQVKQRLTGGGGNLTFLTLWNRECNTHASD